MTKLRPKEYKNKITQREAKRDLDQACCLSECSHPYALPDSHSTFIPSLLPLAHTILHLGSSQDVESRVLVPGLSLSHPFSTPIHISEPQFSHLFNRG